MSLVQSSLDLDLHVLFVGDLHHPFIFFAAGNNGHHVRPAHHFQVIIQLESTKHYYPKLSLAFHLLLPVLLILMSSTATTTVAAVTTMTTTAAAVFLFPFPTALTYVADHAHCLVFVVLAWYLHAYLLGDPSLIASSSTVVILRGSHRTGIPLLRNDERRNSNKTSSNSNRSRKDPTPTAMMPTKKQLLQQRQQQQYQVSLDQIRRSVEKHPHQHHYFSEEATAAS